MKPKSFSLGLWLVPAVFCMQALGQQFSINWYKIAGGGGASTGGVYAVTGTIGQQDASGPLTGGNYSLTGGFWALASLVQTPGAPTLLISGGANTVSVYWQDVPGWGLQQNSSVSDPAGWTASTGVTTSNGTNYLTISPPRGNFFFRLSKPARSNVPSDAGLR